MQKNIENGCPDALKVASNKVKKEYGFLVIKFSLRLPSSMVLPERNTRAKLKIS